MSKTTHKAISKTKQKSLLQEFKQLHKLWPYLKNNRALLFWGMLLIPLISFLQSWRPFIMRNAIDKGISQKDFSVLSHMALLFCGAVLLEYVVRGIQGFCTSLATHRMVRQLRDKLVSHLMHLPAKFHDNHMSGALVTRSTSDFDNLNESLNQGVLTAIIDFAVLIGCVIGMFMLDAKLALAIVVLLPLVIWLITFFSRMLKRVMMASRHCLAKLNGFTQECLYSHSTLKLLNAAPHVSRNFDSLSKDYRDMQMRSVIIDAFLFALLDGIAAVSIGIIFWIVAVYIFEFNAAGVSAGLLIAFAQYAQQVFEPLKQLGNKVAMLQGAFTAIDRIFGLLDHKQPEFGDVKKPQIEGAVSFQNITFQYNPDHTVLKNVSFELPAGTSTAFVGATGSGKTTTVKLLTKMYTGYEGNILLDGSPLQDLNSQHLRQHIGIVPQDIALFSGSIAFNIGLGHAGVTDADIEAAAKVVGADVFINQKPDGYNHHIQEQGSNLSHGQRQLIAFARALVRKPSLVILDEATSSIDPESEQLIQNAIQKMLQGRSVVIIAHRLSTIQKCDNILVFDQGELIEQGNHTELLGKNQHYAKLYYKMKKGPS